MSSILQKENMKMKTMIASLTLTGFLFSEAAFGQNLTTYNFTAEDPSYLGGSLVGTGSFTFDADLISGVDFDILTPAAGNLLAFDFTVFGQTFTDVDDSFYPDFPRIELFDGIPNFMLLTIREPPTAIDESSVAGISVGGVLFPDGSGGFDTAMDIELIPEPTTFALNCIGIAVVLLLRCKHIGRVA